MWRGLRSAAVVLLLGFSAVAPALADDISELEERLDRLTRDLADLRQQVYNSSGGTAGGTVAGPDVELRLQALQQELRNLTGMVEQVTYQQNQLAQRLDLLQGDLEFRLTALEGGTQTGAAPAPAATTGGTTTAGEPQVLGTVTEEELAAVGTGSSGEATAPAQTAALPGGTPQEQYDYAFGLLRQADYDGAEVALKTFIANNPSDPLVANAKYWLGETFYVRGRYQEAAEAFGVAYQDHPDGAKAPDNLLKLGLSLSLLGNNADACTVLAELGTRYPNAAANLLQRAQQEQQRLGCS